MILTVDRSDFAIGGLPPFFLRLKAIVPQSALEFAPTLDRKTVEPAKPVPS